MAMLIGMMVTAAGLALLGKVLKESIRLRTSSIYGGLESSDKVIEIDEYEILDDTPNRATNGYKVTIQD